MKYIMLLKVAVILTLLHYQVKSCLFKLSDGKENYQELAQLTNGTARVTSSDCECGLKDIRRWTVYVIVNNETNHPCLGIIITSNLVLTSHGCLLNHKEEIHVFDLWDVKSKNTLKPMESKIRIFSPFYRYNHEEFQVLKVIPSLQYTFTRSLTNKFVESDILLIKVDAEFPERELSLACLDNEEPQNSLFGYPAQYYDVANRFTFRGTILSLKQCKKRFGDETELPGDDKYRLCFRYSGPPVDYPGGPIVLTTQYPKRSVIVGFVEGNAGALESANRKDNFLYFVATKGLIGYIEHRAAEESSSWCDDNHIYPEMFAPDEWPWEDPEEEIVRDSSLDCECGIANHAKSTGRIVGGETATPYEFGWMVYLKISSWICTGTIINDRVILTAAHCIIHEVTNQPISEPLQNLLVSTNEILAKINAHYTKGDPESIQVKIKRVEYHLGYLFSPQKRFQSEFDVALLILEEPLQFPTGRQSKGIRPICLPELDNLYNSLSQRSAMLVGWGLTDWDDPPASAKQLHKLKTSIRNQGWGFDHSLAAGDNSDNNAFKGDSGGPLMLQSGTTGRWAQAGVISRGVSNDEFRKSVLADMQKMAPFINYYSHKYGAKWCEGSNTRNIFGSNTHLEFCTTRPGPDSKCVVLPKFPGSYD